MRWAVVPRGGGCDDVVNDNDDTIKYDDDAVVVDKDGATPSRNNGDLHALGAQGVVQR